jgi:hypothetical protein
MSNFEGRAQAITVMTPVKRGWIPRIKSMFWLIKMYPPLTTPLRQLSFIHFARWSFVREIPYNGPPQQREKLNYSYMLFMSNFNGRWDEYIDTFSYTQGKIMDQVWGSAHNYPGSLPVKPFEDYIRKNEFEASHYASAYPHATITAITSALEIKERFALLQDQARNTNPEQFKAAYETFLTDIQRQL